MEFDIRVYTPTEEDNVFNVEVLNAYNDEYANLYEGQQTDNIKKNL
jgi:hypothetical protein